MKKGLLGCLMLLVTPLAGFAQYPPMYGTYPQYRPTAPYGYPAMGYPQQPGYMQPMMPQQPMMMPQQPMMMPQQPMMQPIPGYNGPRATPAQPTQNPGPSTQVIQEGTSSSEFPTFDAGVLGTPPAPSDPVDGDLLNPRQRRPDRFWFSAVYTPIFIRSAPLVPLVTVGIPSDPNPIAGALGSPGTTVVFGNQDLDFGRLDGIRVGAGVWFDTQDHLGLEVMGLLVQPRHIRFSTGSDAAGNPVIARPVFVTNFPPAEDSNLVSYPNIRAGAINIDAKTEFADMEINARLQDYFSPVTRGSWLFGLRTARLNEHINISDTYTLLPGGQAAFRGQPIAVGDSITINDRFRTINQFFGLQTGGAWALDLDRFFLELHGKVAIGVTQEHARIDGSTILNPLVGVQQSTVGGLLAQTSNIGVFNRYQFSFMPEVGINFGFNLLDCLRIKGGYSCMVWTDVSRPGQIIDRRVDVTQVPSSFSFGQNLPGTPAPTFTFQDQLFWAHIFNVGVELHY